jgi:hypothetical protein
MVNKLNASFISHLLIHNRKSLELPIQPSRRQTCPWQILIAEQRDRAMAARSAPRDNTEDVVHRACEGWRSAITKSRVRRRTRWAAAGPSGHRRLREVDSTVAIALPPRLLRLPGGLVEVVAGTFLPVSETMRRPVLHRYPIGDDTTKSSLICRRPRLVSAWP